MSPGAKEFGRQRAREVELAHDQPVADDQAERATGLGRDRLGAPRALGEPYGCHADAVASARGGLFAERLGEVAVEVKKAFPANDGIVRTLPHRSLLPRRRRGRCATEGWTAVFAR
jgi:hypothetical protein